MKSGQGDTPIIMTLQRQISNHRRIRGIADASTTLTLYQNCSSHLTITKALDPLLFQLPDEDSESQNS